MEDLDTKNFSKQMNCFFQWLYLLCFDISLSATAFFAAEYNVMWLFIDFSLEDGGRGQAGNMLLKDEWDGFVIHLCYT